MKFRFLILFLIMTTTSIFAKRYIKGEIDYLDGTSKAGYIGLPIGNLDKKISFKTSEDASPQKLSAENISSIIFGNRGELVAIVRIYRKLAMKKSDILYKKPIWALWVGGCDGYNLYHEYDTYRLNRKHQLFFEYSTYGTYLYIKKDKEKYAANMGMELTGGSIAIGKNSGFRKLAKIYFKDDPDIIKRLEQKEFDNIYQLLEYKCNSKL